MRKASTMGRWRVIGALMLAFGVACGSPDGSVTDAQQAATTGDINAFCDAARELDKSARNVGGHPDDSQLDRFVDTAPSEIKDDAEILAASAREFRAGNEEAASSDEIQAAADRFDAYVEENCEDA